MNKFILLLLTTVLVACGSRYATNNRPVPGVEPYGGREMKQNTQGALGMVYAEARGSDCDDALAKAYTRLLEQARAMGGTRVIHAQTKHAYNWSGHAACSRGGKRVFTRGLAMP